MNLATVGKIAKAVLYEGYMLYPYRPSSVKNQQRFNFGVLFPQSYSEAQSGNDASEMQTECLVEGSSLTAIEIRLRFLQLVARSVGKPLHGDLDSEEAPEFHLVLRLEAGGRVYQPWQEAVEREVILPVFNLESLTHNSLSHAFTFPKSNQFEDVHDDAGALAGIIIREQRELHGAVDISSEHVGDGLFKVMVRVRNLTPHSSALQQGSRDFALMSSLVSTHTVLGALDGKFISLLAPPNQMSELAAGCKNIGTWPVLVGQEGDSDTLLSSPIILYDYPQVAPESAGDLFDGTEIDEILSLRIMTLTDDEKREMSQSDERARQMLERTETMPVEQLMKLHGVLRGLRSLKEESE
jgi:hydrogenase maturation protease